MSWEIVILAFPCPETQPNIAKIWLLGIGCINHGGTRWPHRMGATKTRAALGMEIALCMCVCKSTCSPSPAAVGYLGPDFQSGSVRTHDQHWKQIAAAVVARPCSQMSPHRMGVTGNAKPLSELLCLTGCALSQDIRCPHLAVWEIHHWAGREAALCVPSCCSSLTTFPDAGGFWRFLCHSCAALWHQPTAELLEACREGNTVSSGSPGNFALLVAVRGAVAWWGPPP